MTWYRYDGTIPVKVKDGDLWKNLENEMTTDDYDDWLDNIYGTIDVCGCEHNASYVLRRVSEYDYLIGWDDFIDSIHDDLVYTRPTEEEAEMWHGFFFVDEVDQ